MKLGVEYRYNQYGGGRVIIKTKSPYGDFDHVFIRVFKDGEWEVLSTNKKIPLETTVRHGIHVVRVR